MTTALRIAPCTGDDLELLLSDDPLAHLAAHHRERFLLQSTGQATYLLAWRGGLNVGRATVYVESKYQAVRRARPGTAEINALEADPQGRGTGTALIAAAEAIAAQQGHLSLGLAVEPSNSGARRLYERLGYRSWGHGQVIDEWTEIHADHTIQHRDPCDYLIKPIERQDK